MARPKKPRRHGLQMMPEYDIIKDTNGVEKKKIAKRRNVGCILWMEDLEREGLTYYDLLEHLDGLCMEIVCSPVHDRDTYTPADVRDWCERHIDPDTGDVAEDDQVRIPKVGDKKKEHVHVGFKMTQQLSRRECSEKLLGGFIDYPETKWAIIPNMDSYACYMCHKHNPEKAYYPPNTVQAFGGFDISKVLAEDKTRTLYQLADIMNYVHDHKLRYVHQVWNWAMSTGDYQAIEVVSSKASFINMILASERQQRIDEATAKEKTGSQGWQE